MPAKFRQVPARRASLLGGPARLVALEEIGQLPALLLDAEPDAWPTVRGARDKLWRSDQVVVLCDEASLKEPGKFPPKLFPVPVAKKILLVRVGIPAESEVSRHFGGKSGSIPVKNGNPQPFLQGLNGGVLWGRRLRQGERGGLGFAA